jgi:hypothetical protein
MTTKWTDLPVSVVLAAVDLCDGHSIFEPEMLTNIGVPPELVKEYTVTHKSDFSNAKYVIFDNKTGEPRKEMEGVYGLAILAGMVRDFGLTCRETLGRGFQARIYQEALHKHLDEQPATA